MNLLSEIKGKNKDELWIWGNQHLVNGRIWIQEHGEAALLIGLALGLLMAVAFKVVLGVVILLAGAALVLWYIAPERSPSVLLSETSYQQTNSAPPLEESFTTTEIVSPSAGTPSTAPKLSPYPSRADGLDTPSEALVSPSGQPLSHEILHPVNEEQDIPNIHSSGQSTDQVKKN